MEDIGVEMEEYGRIWEDIGGHGKLLEDMHEYGKI